MRYIFMDNYRGFSQTLVPLQRATFLVGENSTGKSSFLTLVHLLSTPEFGFPAEFSRRAFADLGGFRDIVSVTSVDRSCFSVGVLLTTGGRTRSQAPKTCSFMIVKYADEEGLPRMVSCTLFAQGTLATVFRVGEKTCYRFDEYAPPRRSDEASLRSFLLEGYRQSTREESGAKVVPDNIPSGVPLHVLAEMLPAFTGKEDRERVRAFSADISALLYPRLGSWTWMAPIRTRPHRIYEGFKTDFTPEGDHTAYVIRKTLGSREAATEFAKLLATFGKSSGLFTGVKAHSFGRDPAAPFEVTVGLHGRSLNISNVGYGVSQVLPVVVEMVTRPKGHWFAIQQPEVHLHPRAQAALGDLLQFLVVNQNHGYIVETHSDYLIDRFRLRIRETGQPTDAQVLFFARTDSGNTVHVLPINSKGQYSSEQPDEFRRFFINEEVNLLEI